MAQTQDPNPAQGAAYQALEEENRVLRQRLSGDSAAPDLRLLRLTETLRQENLRLAAESQDLGAKNIELVFQVEELEQRVQETQASADLAGQALEAARQEAAKALQERDQARNLGQEQVQAERQRLEAELAARLQEVARSGQARAEALEGELAQSQARAEALEGELAQSRTRAEALEGELAQSQARAEALEGELAQGQARAEALEGELAQSRTRAEALEGELAQSRTRAEALEGELAEAGVARDEAMQRDQVAARELAAAREDLEQRGRRLEQLEGLLAEAERRASEAALAEEENGRLKDQVEAATARAESLEATLKQLQEQFFQRIEEQRQVAAAPMDPAGPPDQALSRFLESLLGSSGPHLVARVYARCRVDQASRQPQELERVLHSLEETAARLLSTDEQRARLSEGLGRLRASLLGPAEAPAAPPEATPAPAAETPAAPPEATPAPAAEAPAAPPEATPAPAAETPAAPPEATPAPAAETPAAPPEATPAPAAEAPADIPLHLGSQDDTVFHDVTEPALLKQIEEGNKLLALEKFDQSWDVFQKLAQEHPQALPILEGLFYNYVDSCCWVEAAKIGRRILYAELDGPRRGRFVKALHAALIEAFKAVRDAGERKLLLMNLAELHLDDPAQTRDFLGKARQIPGRTPADSRIDYYMMRLQEKDPAEQLRSVLGALEGVTERLDLFDGLDGSTSQAANRTLRPAAKVVLALVRQGRQAAAAAQEEGGERVAPWEPDPNLVDEEHDEGADLVLEFLLNQLLPRAHVAIPFPDPTFSALLDRSEPVPTGWKPAEVLDRLNWRLFRTRDMQARLYRGDEPFWLKATPEPVGQVLFHPDVAGLPVSEQQGLALRALFHLHHRHLHVLRASEILDAPLRCRLLGLTRDVVQDSGTDVSDWIEREIDALDPGRPDLAAALDEMLDRLYNHCLREEFLILKDFLVPGKLFAARLEGSADRFVARLVGVAEASYGIARQKVGRTPLFERLEKEGFQALYAPPLHEHRALRLRLQRLWLHCLC